MLLNFWFLIGIVCDRARMDAQLRVNMINQGSLEQRMRMRGVSGYLHGYYDKLML